MHGTAPHPDTAVRTGLIQGAGAYFLWGMLPLYFDMLTRVDAGETVSNRVIWSLLMLIVLVPALGRGAKLRATLRNRRALAMLAMSATLIAANWLTYVWSVTHGHVLATSLGYFLNPLVNVTLGVVFLGERLDRVQAVAVALAAIGVAVLAAQSPQALWIALTLAISFGVYGLVRKQAPVESLEGLTVETLLLGGPALAYIGWMGWHGGLSLGREAGTSALLVLAGPITAAPLILFAAAAKRLSLIALGLLQYIAPSIQFVLAIALFHEPLSTGQMLCFAFIWAGCLLFAGNGIVRARRRQVALQR